LLLYDRHRLVERQLHDLREELDQFVRKALYETQGARVLPEKAQSIVKICMGWCQPKRYMLEGIASLRLKPTKSTDSLTNHPLQN
ncbi:6048_t:CDS:1, partial [Cetraspora pellucida]